MAGLIAALACKNDLFLSGCAGAYLNGLAGDRLYERVGMAYNASDLVEEIPRAYSTCLLSQKSKYDLDGGGRVRQSVVEIITRPRYNVKVKLAIPEV